MRRAQILLHVFLGVAAVASGQAFVREPSRRALGMSADYLEGSPFQDFRVPGLFLATVLGSANLLSAFMLFRRQRAALSASLATGLLLVVWIAVQTAIIGLRHWSQLVWWVTFTIVTVNGALLVRRDTGRSSMDSGDG